MTMALFCRRRDAGRPGWPTRWWSKDQVRRPRGTEQHLVQGPDGHLALWSSPMRPPSVINARADLHEHRIMGPGMNPVRDTSSASTHRDGVRSPRRVEVALKPRTCSRDAFVCLRGATCHPLECVLHVWGDLQLDRYAVRFGVVGEESHGVCQRLVASSGAKVGGKPVGSAWTGFARGSEDDPVSPRNMPAIRLDTVWLRKASRCARYRQAFGGGRTLGGWCLQSLPVHDQARVGSRGLGTRRTTTGCRALS